MGSTVGKYHPLMQPSLDIKNLRLKDKRIIPSIRTQFKKLFHYKEQGLITAVQTQIGQRRLKSCQIELKRLQKGLSTRQPFQNKYLKCNRKHKYAE